MIERASCSVEYRGCSRASVTGSSVLQCLPMRRWAGLVPTPSVGVLRQSRSARHSDPPDALLLVKRRLTVLTAFSAFPLDCGYRGDDVTCLKDQTFANLANSSDANWGPLSVTKVSGTPYRENTIFISLMTLRDVTEVTRATSM